MTDTAPVEQAAIPMVPRDLQNGMAVHGVCLPSPPVSQIQTLQDLLLRSLAVLITPRLVWRQMQTAQP